MGPIYDNLKNYIELGDIQKAAEELNCLLKSTERREMDDELAILAAGLALQTDDEELAWEFIRKGLLFNGKNAMLYYMLGNYYEDKNVNQAWLCYENAEYYCEFEEELALIRQRKTVMREQGEWSVNRFSIVLLTHNLKEVHMQCIQSIRETLPPGSYELVVVDNASSDGTVEWLKQQNDIQLICNKQNRGVPGGRNQGIKAAGAEHDILLLNSDTIVPANAIFWLRMGLYAEEKAGAVRSVSDYEKTEKGPDEYRKSAERVNVPERNFCEDTTGLVAPAVLIKRRALDETGLLDVRFSPGGGEDVDFGVRLNLGGWRTMICHNSVFFCRVSGDRKNGTVREEHFKNTREIFQEKWGFDMEYYTHSRDDMIDFIRSEKSDRIKVLEIGCGCGATLNRIKYLYPAAEVFGIELNEMVAGFGAVCRDIRQGDIVTIELPYEKETFDYIIMGDVVEHLSYPQGVIKRLRPYLRKNGKLLCSIPNLLYREVIANLLCGKFEYEDEGILDRTHVRFFTWSSIEKMMEECGFRIIETKVSGHAREPEDEYTPIIDAVCRIPGVVDKSQFLVYQYIFCAERIS